MQRLRLQDCENDVCPLTRRPVREDALIRYKGHVVGFAEPALRDQFAASLLLFEAAISYPDCATTYHAASYPAASYCIAAE